MLKRVSTLLFLALSSAFSMEVDDIVNKSFQNNNSIKAMQESISSLDEDIKLSTKYQNPTLSFGVNDIHFDEPFKRDKEAMQAQFIGISQVVPINDKLKIKEDIAKKSKEIGVLELKNQKLLLKSKIYQYAFNIKILEKRVKLLEKYQQNLKKSKELLIKLFNTSRVEQNKILTIEILEDKIELQKKQIEANIKKLFVNLERVSLVEVKSIELNLHMGSFIVDRSALESHPKLLALKEESNRQNRVSQFELASKNSDVKLSLNYFNRDEKYEDYLSFSVAIPLGLYERESLKSLKAKKMARSSYEKFLDMKEEFSKELDLLEIEMQKADSLYNLLKLSIIKKQNRVGEVLNSYNSYESLNPIKLIDNLNEVLKFELQALDEKRDYFDAVAKALYFQGSIK